MVARCSQLARWLFIKDGVSSANHTVVASRAEPTEPRTELQLMVANRQRDVGVDFAGGGGGGMKRVLVVNRTRGGELGFGWAVLPV